MVRPLPPAAIGMRRAPLRASAAGYSLIELMMVVMLIGVLAGMATFQIASARPGMLGDGAMRQVMGELNAAREMALTQRRLMQINFVGTDMIRITRREVPSGTTVLREVYFEGGVRYGLIAGASDTPDAFGKASATSFGSATAIMFGTDGQLVDQAGAAVNGTIFLTIPDTASSFRAVTIQGSTGRVRGYKWLGSQWTRG
jgi:prepilin-type N-terminal cleavage/methylation domain-containing protein